MHRAIIGALIKRHVINLTRDTSLLLDLFIWPLSNVFIWGCYSLWMMATKQASHELAVSVVTGIILCRILSGTQSSIAENFVQEVWDRNLLNLFSGPVKAWHWLGAVMFLGTMRAFLEILFSSLFAFFLFDINFFSLGIGVIPIMLSLLLIGWSLGIAMASVLVYFGQTVQMLIWMLPMAFIVFGGVFYPIDVLPLWARTIAQLLPISYSFNALRALIFVHDGYTYNLFMSFGLGIMYLIMSMIFFSYMFRLSCDKGLARL